MKLSFPLSTFNAHKYFLAISEKRLDENMQKKHYEPHRICLTTEENQAKRSENSSFSYAKS